MSQPVRQRPPSVAKGDCGIAVPFFAGVVAVALLGFWPAMVWHGYGGPTGNDWRWDIHSTVAEAVYFGVMAFIIALVVTGRRPASRTPAPAPAAPPEPGPDPAVTMRLLEGLDEIDGYAAEAEKARTGEELDYLNAYGRLPGRERNPQ